MQAKVGLESFKAISTKVKEKHADIKTNTGKANYRWSRVSNAEGPEAVLFNLSSCFTKLGLDEFDQFFLRKIVFCEADGVGARTGVFTKKLVTEAKGLDPPFHPRFDKICPF